MVGELILYSCGCRLPDALRHPHCPTHTFCGPEWPSESRKVRKTLTTLLSKLTSDNDPEVSVSAKAMIDLLYEETPILPSGWAIKEEWVLKKSSDKFIRISPVKGFF